MISRKITRNTSMLISSIFVSLMATASQIDVDNLADPENAGDHGSAHGGQQPGVMQQGHGIGAVNNQQSDKKDKREGDQGRTLQPALGRQSTAVLRQPP